MIEFSILLIENDKVDIMMMQRALADLKAPYSLWSVSNGAQALEFLRNPVQAKPAIILLDINTPVMDGLEFLAEINEYNDLRLIPVIVLTTSLDDYDVVRSFELGVSGYMVKPFDYFEYVKALKCILDYWTMSRRALVDCFDPDLPYKRKLKKEKGNENTIY
jgi:CheY-like chemotaxis protein